MLTAAAAAAEVANKEAKADEDNREMLLPDFPPCVTRSLSDAVLERVTT